MAQSLLLISDKPEDKTFAEAVAAKADLTFRGVRTVVEGAKVLSQEDFAILMVNVGSKQEYDAFELAIQNSVGLYSAKVNPNFIHFMSPVDLGGVEYLIQSPLFGNFVHTHYDGQPKESGEHYGRVVKASLLERAFGLSLTLGPQVKVQTVRLSSSTQKTDAVEAVKNYLVKAQFQNRTAALIANSVDELLLNAIYDAPVDALGKPLFAQLPRSSVLKLEDRSQVEMEIGFDGTYVAVSVIDKFGSLEKRKLLAHISKIYVKEDYKVKTSVAGAGIGLATVSQMGGSFFFASEAGVKTQVTLFFRNAANYREFRQQFRFISTQFYF